MELKPGLQVERKFKVTEEMLASIVGSGRVDVLSTPSMIALMESVAESLVADKLPEGMITVGTKVCVSHRAPAWLGDEITIQVKLKEVSGKKMIFDVFCLRGEVLVGEGEHERYVVEKERFSRKK